MTRRKICGIRRKIICQQERIENAIMVTFPIKRLINPERVIPPNSIKSISVTSFPQFHFISIYFRSLSSRLLPAKTIHPVFSLQSIQKTRRSRKSRKIFPIFHFSAHYFPCLDFSRFSEFEECTSTSGKKSEFQRESAYASKCNS